ncbi:response regulator transcription factor [Salinicola lusitanus]|uniref:response regulator transcription factor n=1 Tax=Salinicola lusitanus TaxID=1949085 RepID=UPI001F0C9C2C|nr:response regulator transcription factor [Salinicola lusitanus]
MTTSMHIGVLEDDPDQQAFIEICLDGAGHRPRMFSRASEFRRGLKQHHFDMMILDWYLPDASGMDVLAQLRQHDGWQGPILFVTANQEEETVVKALALGADDFLGKPLRPRELVARVNALARRVNSPQPRERHRLGDYELHASQRQVSLAGEWIPLTEREYRLVSLLFAHAGELLSRAHLLEVVWGHKGDIATRTVDTHVSRLRRKLALDGRHGVKLQSIYQHGYRLDVQLVHP